MRASVPRDPAALRGDLPEHRVGPEVSLHGRQALPGHPDLRRKS